MKKTLWTLNIGGYSPEITDMTYPLLKRYAHKIGAEFKVITERKFPEWPIVYEKLQIHELGRDSDWNIYMDSDALVHPETVDWTNFVQKDTVMHNGFDMAAVRWRYDNYFRRDGRNIGSCNWCTIGSDWCLDLWRPLDDLTFEEAVDRITPTVGELTTVITADHLIDDFTLSRNIARYGLKFKTLVNLQKEIGLPDANFYWHQYTISVKEKVEKMREILKEWKV